MSKVKSIKNQERPKILISISSDHVLHIERDFENLDLKEIGLLLVALESVKDDLIYKIQNELEPVYEISNDEGVYESDSGDEIDL